MEIRHLLPLLLRAWVGDPLVQYFHRLVTVSCRLDNLVFGNKSFYLTMQEREALREGVFDYNRTLSILARHFHNRGKAYCNFTIKNHYLAAYRAAKTGVSPRLAFANRGKTTCPRCEKMMPKYIRGLDLLMKHSQK